jgi:hypothetical protein
MEVFLLKNYYPIPWRDSISRPVTLQAETMPLDNAARAIRKVPYTLVRFDLTTRDPAGRDNTPRTIRKVFKCFLRQPLIHMYICTYVCNDVFDCPVKQLSEFYII